MPPVSSSAAERTYKEKAEQLAGIARRLRRRAGLTLQEVGRRCGLSVSTLSKIENSQLSPSYETILRLANGLSVDVTELFSAESSVVMATGRRSVTRRGHGVRHVSPQYQYEMYSADLSRKQFIPLVTRITARRIEDFPQLPRHEGEEFIYVLSGAVELHTEHYEPVRLEPGDGCYLDSVMGHACISVGPGDAQILWISSRAGEVAQPAPKPASPGHKKTKTVVR